MMLLPPKPKDNDVESWRIYYRDLRDKERELEKTDRDADREKVARTRRQALAEIVRLENRKQP